MIAAGAASLPDAVRMASLTPAERAGVAASTGSLEPGKRADILLLSESLEVERVFIAVEEFRA
jgi:N-acetylglucosamine-6-phosphate deacetylase